MTNQTTQAKNSASLPLIELGIDETTIRNYFKFLCADENEIFTVAFLFDGITVRPDGSKGKGNVPGYGTYHGKIDDILAVLARLRREHGIDVSLHVTLNRTNAIGRKTKDIESCRVLCVDLDGVEQEKLDDALTHKPALIVQSSEDGSGKFHAYWQLEGRSLETWRLLQLGLAYRFGGDLNLDQVTKTIRVPGVSRVTKSGALFTPKMVFLPNPVKCEPGIKLFPWAGKAFEAAKEARQLTRKQTAKLLSQFQAGKTSNLQDVAQSGRNNFLYGAIKRAIAKFTPGVACGQIEDAFSIGETVNKSFTEPLGESEVESTVKSAFEKGRDLWAFRQGKYLERLGKMETIEVSDVGQGELGNNGHVNGELNGEGKIDVSEFKHDFDDPFLENGSFSDFALATRVLQRFGDRLIRCNNFLYAFDIGEKTWRRQDLVKNADIQEMYSHVVLSIRKEKAFVASFCVDKEGSTTSGGARKKEAQARERFESGAKSYSVISVIERSTSIKVMHEDDFDANSEILYVGNGALNLRTGEIRKDIQAKDYLLNRTMVDYLPGALCPRWLKFLSEVFKGTLEVIPYLQEVFGYSLGGSIDAQVIFCHYGTGGNGKSKVTYALRQLMGSYATKLDNDTFGVTGKNTAIKTERIAAKFEGKRCVIVDDLEKSFTWNEGALKALTADTIRSRGEYEKSREVRNRAKVHIGMNETPKPEAENRSVLRRLHIVPYLEDFTNSMTRGAEIEAMIREELTGILNWAVVGYQRLANRGEFDLPAACKIALEEYAEANYNIEPIVRELWEAIPVPENKIIGENFFCTEDLVQEFNEALFKRTGDHHKALSPDILGREIKRVLKPNTDRLRVCHVQKRGFYLKRLYTPEQSNEVVKL